MVGMRKRLRLVPNVFARHVSNESCLACPRTGGCTVLKHAQPFLDVLSDSWRETDELLTELAKKFGCSEAEVRDDATIIWDELASQRFVEVDDVKSVASTVRGDGEKLLEAEEEDSAPLGDFYARHNLPCELHIDLTDRCNEHCVHCYIPQGGGRMMPTDDVMKVLQEFREAQGLTVFFSGGECMLHPDFAVILRKAKALGLNIVVMSNLSLCNADGVQLLKEIDPQFVNVSLYSMRAKEHDAITRLPGSWNKTIDAIWDLQHAGVHVRLATPILKANREAVAVLRKFAADQHMHDVFECDIIGKLDHDCSNQAHALSIEEMADVVRQHRDILAKAPCDACLCDPEAKVCDIGEGRLCVNAKGEYYPCDGFHGMVLGNVKTDGLLEVWRGERLNRLREMKNKDFGTCATCQDRSWCKVCMMRNFNETGNMFAHAPERCKMAALYRQIWEEN